jgi:hypothetical protein
VSKVELWQLIRDWAKDEYPTLIFTPIKESKLVAMWIEGTWIGWVIDNHVDFKYENESGQRILYADNPDFFALLKESIKKF